MCHSSICLYTKNLGKQRGNCYTTKTSVFARVRVNWVQFSRQLACVLNFDSVLQSNGYKHFEIGLLHVCFTRNCLRILWEPLTFSFEHKSFSVFCPPSRILEAKAENSHKIINIKRCIIHNIRKTCPFKVTALCCHVKRFNYIIRGWFYVVIKPNSNTKVRNWFFNAKNVIIVNKWYKWWCTTKRT